MKKLYFYSTISWYENRIKLGEEPWLKIGGSAVQTVEDRINQQDTTSNPEPLICLGEFDVDFDDTDFHEHLDDNGYVRSREDKHREFYNTTVEQAKYELEKYSIKRSKFVNEVKAELEPYDHQTYFVDKILSSWEVWKQDLEFVLFAKCRSGKSFMCLTAVDRFENAKITAVLSRFNSPKQSWIDDSKNYKNFSNIIGIDTQLPNWKEQYDIWSKTDKKIVLVGTIQGFHKISNLPIDLIIYDEAHIGYAGKQWKAIRKKMKCPVIYVSGTAYKLQWDFPESMKYVYTYFEEQRDKKLGIRKDVPSVKIIRRKYDTTGGKKIFGQEPDALQNIFNVGDDGEFIDRAAVQDFVISEFGVQKRVHPNQRLLRNSNHIFLTINSVPAAHAIEDVFNGTRFAPLVVTGDTKEDQKTIKKHIDNNPNGTVIITKLANVLGLTVKEIDTVINFSEGKSLEVWTQVMFRGGSSSQDWTYIDYAPERCLESLRKLYFAACDRNPEIADYKLTQYFSIIDWLDGEEVLTEELVNEILATAPSNAVRLLSGTPVGDKSLLDEVNFDVELKPTESNVIKKVGVNENDSDGKTNKIKESSKKEIDRIKDVREGTVKAIKERLALVLYREIKDGNNTCTIHSLMKSVHYKNDTGDTSNILQQCLLYGYEDERILNRRISQSFLDIQYSISQDEGVTLDKLSHSRKDQQHIPLDLLDKMLSEIPIRGKMIIIGDPSGLHSLRAIKYGWKPEDITVWENDPCHVYAVRQVDNKITILEDYKTTLKPLDDLLMKFDAVLTNPPFQNNKQSGNKRGSGYKNLWHKIAKKSISLLKDDGFASLVTPESAFSGSEKFTSLLSGKKSKVDLDYVEFGLRKSYFKSVGIEICRWVARKSFNVGHLTSVKTSNQEILKIDAKKVFKVYKDSKIQEIINTLVSHNGDKLSFSTSGQYNFAGVTALLEKSGKDTKLTKDFVDKPTETHKYKLIDNGNIRYTSVLYGNDYNKPRVFISRMKNPYVVHVDDSALNTESTLVMYFDTIQKAQIVADLLNDDFSRKVIMTMCSNGRISGGDLSQLPSIPFDQILNSDQIDYINSQL